ncbi:MAG TPA: MaoC/PaaZ C-terminal domain-containing protein [Burkholderiales bacterium]|nr:MaoC/PaaZ C-terminal domain-containing protein [Burkholderiales bacterium]
MRISSAIVGREAGPDPQRIDKRWLMAYNAALGEVSDQPHPLFPVCYEWPATQALRKSTGLQEINARLVHAQHDLTIHRPLREEKLLVRGSVIACLQRKPGTLVVFRFETRDEKGEPVSTSHYGMLYRGVMLDGGDRGTASIEDPRPLERDLPLIGTLSVAATAGHVYTECARIWNPIHTDPEYARAAGLPGIILHGTATLALSVSKILEKLKIELKRVRCRFAGMVPMPSTLAVHASRGGDEILFETRDEKGQAVIERGRIG